MTATMQHHAATTAAALEPLAVADAVTARQGDVLLVPCRAAPTWRDWARVGPDGAVLVEGRAAHVLRGDAEVAGWLTPTDTE